MSATQTQTIETMAQILSDMIDCGWDDESSKAAALAKLSSKAARPRVFRALAKHMLLETIECEPRLTKACRKAIRAL